MIRPPDVSALLSRRCHQLCTYSVCQEQYEKMEGYSAGRGNVAEDAETLQDCQDACSEFFNCRGVDWSEDNQECQVFLDETDLQPSEDYDHYLRLRCPDDVEEPTLETTKRLTTVSEYPDRLEMGNIACTGQPLMSSLTFVHLLIFSHSQFGPCR